MQLLREFILLDGIENCLQYVNNFDPKKSSNPFAYFTQIIYYAFIRRIQKEKKQSHVKNKLLEKNAVMAYSVMEGDHNSYQVPQIDLQNFLPEEDVYKPKKKASHPKTKNLEKFMKEE